MARMDVHDERLMAIPQGLVAIGAAAAEFEALADLADLPPGALLRVTRGDHDVLLIHGERGICVIDDRCPHMSAPLSLGTLDGCVIACPLHRGRFDLCDGSVVQFPTTGGLDADGGYHPPWTPTDAGAKPEPTDLKAMARAATRVRRLRYYPVRIVGTTIEVRLPRQR
jgi:nitrite reductase/ring-hydroxylating ferredoxin subunit